MTKEELIELVNKGFQETKKKEEKRLNDILKKIPSMTDDELKKWANIEYYDEINTKIKDAAKKEIEKRKKFNEFKTKILHAKEIELFLELIETSFNVGNFDIENIEFNNNKYNMHYNNGNLLIKYDNGKKANLIISKHSTRATDGYSKTWEETWIESTIRYELNNGEFISFNSKNISNIIHDKLVKIYYGNESQSKINLDWDLQPKCITINEHGNILYKNYLISCDLGEIISINNKKLPTYDILMKLDAKSDIKKIEEFVEKSKLSTFSIDILKKSIEHIEEKGKEYKEILDKYKETLTTVRTLLQIKEKALNITNSFNEKELNFLYNIFERTVETKRREAQLEEEERNSTNNRMKKLIRSLNPEELTALKNNINN